MWKLANSFIWSLTILSMKCSLVHLKYTVAVIEAKRADTAHQIKHYMIIEFMISCLLPNSTQLHYQHRLSRRLTFKSNFIRFWYEFINWLTWFIIQTLNNVHNQRWKLGTCRWNRQSDVTSCLRHRYLDEAAQMALATCCDASCFARTHDYTRQS